MFCMKCGTKLPDGARFCYNCGNQIEEIIKEVEENADNLDSVSNGIEKETKDELNAESSSYLESEIYKKIKIFGGEFTVTKEHLIVSNLLSSFKTVAEERAVEIVKKYEEQQNLKNAVINIPAIGEVILNNTYIGFHKLLVEGFDLFEINQQVFLTKCYDFIADWKHRSSFLEDLLEQIELEKEERLQEIARIQLRKSIKGNIELKQKANGQYDYVMIPPEDHQKAECFEEYSRKLVNTYQSYETIESLKWCMHDIVLEIGNTCLEILEAKNIIDDTFSRNDEELTPQLEMIAHNNDKDTKMLGLLNMYPYSSELLTYAYINGIGDRKQIVEYGEMMGIDYGTKFIRKSIEKMLFSTNYSDYATLDTVMKKIKEISDTYSIDLKSYSDFVSNKMEASAASALVFDGMHYDNLDVVLEANRFLNDLRTKVRSTKENDRDSLKEFINQLQESNLLSKDKYIQGFENVISIQNRNAKFLLNVEFNTEEEATKNKATYNLICHKIFDNQITNIQLIDECLNTAELELDERIKGNVINLLEIYKDLFIKSISYEKTNANELVTMPRFEYSKSIIDMEIIDRLMNRYGLQNDVFKSLYQNLKSQYLVVFGTQCASVEDAIKEYVNCVKHARAYKKTLDEKATEKKGFFGKLKQNIVGAWNSQYEGDYNRVTLNGMKTIPEEDDEVLKNMLSLTNYLQNEEKSIVQKLETLNVKTITDDNVKTLSIDSLFIENKNSLPASPLQEIFNVLTGTIVEIRITQSSKFDPKELVSKHLSLIDKEGFLKNATYQKPGLLEGAKKYYTVIYSDVSDIAESINYLKQQGIECRIIMYKNLF